MKHDFGLDLNKLIDIPAKANCAILESGTFALFSNNTQQAIYIKNDYKQILEAAEQSIYFDEKGSAFSRLDIRDIKNWKLQEFLKEYTLVFHQFLPAAWQKKHRLEFINELFNNYYEHKAEQILTKAISEATGSIANYSYLFNEFIRFKNLRNRIKLKKYPVLCALATRDNINSCKELIEYLEQQFEPNEYTLDIKTDRHEGTKILLALKDKDILSYIGLTILENWKVDAKVDFIALNQYMDNIEKYIEKSYLR